MNTNKGYHEALARQEAVLVKRENEIVARLVDEYRKDSLSPIEFINAKNDNEDYITPTIRAKFLNAAI